MTFTISCFADEISEELATQLSVMKNHNIRYMEPRNVYAKNISALDDAEVARFGAQLSAAGVSVSALGSPIGKIGIDDDFEAHLDKLRRLTAIAHALKTDYIRIFSFYPPKGATDPEQWFDAVCARTAAMVAVAEKEGVTLLHENEKDIYGDIAPRCKKLFERFYGRHYAATFDPANFVQCGQPVMEAYELLKPYIKYIHIKDALFADGRVVPAGCGDGEVDKLLAALNAGGYDGFLSLEPHLGDFKGFAGLERGGKTLFDSDTDSVGRFDLAADSLDKILEAL